MLRAAAAAVAPGEHVAFSICVGLGGSLLKSWWRSGQGLMVSCTLSPGSLRSIPEMTTLVAHDDHQLALVPLQLWM